MPDPEILDWSVTLLMPDGTHQTVTRPKGPPHPETVRWSMMRISNTHTLDVGVKFSPTPEKTQIEEEDKHGTT